MDVPRTAFIAPALPRLRSPAPTGDLLQRDGASSAIYGKNGGDLTRRFPPDRRGCARLTDEIVHDRWRNDRRRVPLVMTAPVEDPQVLVRC